MIFFTVYHTVSDERDANSSLDINLSALIPDIKIWDESDPPTPCFHSASTTPQPTVIGRYYNSEAPLAINEESDYLIEVCEAVQQFANNDEDEFISPNLNSSTSNVLLSVETNQTVTPKQKETIFAISKIKSAMSPAQKQLVDFMSEFSRRRRKATIDVWWLFDDGGKRCAANVSTVFCYDMGMCNCNSVILNFKV